MVERPIAIDLFAGAGGLSLGFEQAGFDIPVAVELDPVHAAVHQFNFPLCQVLPQSVQSLSGKDLRQIAKLTPNQPITALIGGAPCQGFSIIGQRSHSDGRNQLVQEFIRLINELQPQYFVFENVKGLTIGSHRASLEAIVQAMKSTGYQLVTPWQVLNACEYAVPQRRERLFLIGAHPKMPLPSYPKPLKTRVTCADALADIPNADDFDQLLNMGEVRSPLPPPNNRYAAELRCQKPASWHYGYRRQWDCNILTNSIRTRHSDKSRCRFQGTSPGTREPVSHFFRLAPDGLSTTLRAGTDSARGSFTSPRPIHYRYPRCITVREMARLHGFPDWFRLHSTKWHGARQVGNSVPPPLARAIAAELLKAIGHQPTRVRRQAIPLGDTSVLNMTAEAAARYWGIKSPIAQRDRKLAVC